MRLICHRIVLPCVVLSIIVSYTRWVHSVFKSVSYNRSRNRKWLLFHRNWGHFQQFHPLFCRKSRKICPKISPYFYDFEETFSFYPLITGNWHLFQKKIPLFLPFQGWFWILTHISWGNDDNYYKIGQKNTKMETLAVKCGQKSKKYMLFCISQTFLLQNTTSVLQLLIILSLKIPRSFLEEYP